MRLSHAVNAAACTTCNALECGRLALDMTSNRKPDNRCLAAARRCTATGSLAFAVALCAQAQQTYQLDPFIRATSGEPTCPEVKPPVLTEQEMRAQAHSRVERGTSCCLAGTCPCGGAYRRDPEINDRVAHAIQADPRFRDTSVWVTTTRQFVTLQGCVRSNAQRRMLERFVERLPDVALVWNETSISRSNRAR